MPKLLAKPKALKYPNLKVHLEKNQFQFHEKKIFKSLPWAENRLITALCSMFICSKTFLAISILSPEKKIMINFTKKTHFFGRYYIFLALTRHLIGQSPIMKMQSICCQIKKMIFWKSKKKIFLNNFTSFVWSELLKIFLLPEPLPNLPLPLGNMDSNPTGWSFGKIGPITPRDKVM